FRQPRQSDPAAAIDSAGQFGIDLGRSVVAEAGKVDDDLDPVQDFGRKISRILDEDRGSLANPRVCRCGPGHKKPAERHHTMAPRQPAFCKVARRYNRRRLPPTPSPFRVKSRQSVDVSGCTTYPNARAARGVACCTSRNARTMPSHSWSVMSLYTGKASTLYA